MTAARAAEMGVRMTAGANTARTRVARRDWIHWITSGKKAETRERRIRTACDKLACGKRNACCFDRSGMYSKAFSAPEAAE